MQVEIVSAGTADLYLYEDRLKGEKKMSVLSGLEPKEVYRFFEEICAIPHGSYNTKQISDYVVNFAKERGLRYRQDDANNAVIWKSATKGYEDAPTVMIQGHMDMVCEKDQGCEKDMEREGLDLFVEGDTIGARGTTLGGDDGIAVAMALAILDSDDIPHGPLECLFTVDEEVGLLGAQALDASDLNARYLLNLDSEEDRVLTVGCAGSTRASSSFDIERAPFDGRICRLTVDGLIGGHSGEEIHKGRANSNVLMGRMLCEIAGVCELRIVDLQGGAKENAIAVKTSAVISVSDFEAAKRKADELQKIFSSEYRVQDGNIRVTFEEASSPMLPMSEEWTKRIAAFLFCVPFGVLAMSAEVDDLVQTSINIGRVITDDKKVAAHFMVRSSVNSQQDEAAKRVIALADVLGGRSEIASSYSAWEYRSDSRLKEIVIEAFREVYGSDPTVKALHAGLECGILAGKMPGLDCISYGPDLTGIHTPRERMHIASVQRIWRLTKEILKKLR